MRAWAIRAYGEPMQELELPVPQPRARDLLIHMQGAEVGDWDELVRTGEWPMERPFPLVLGLAGAGTVAAAGSDARPFAEGDQVYVYSYPLYDNGAWAEYMVVPHSYAAFCPQLLSPVHAGAVPIVGLTAHETLNKVLQVKSGETVLITAAAGGVGHIAVQIAAGLGAHVVATASKRNHEFLRALGARTLIDYAHEDVVAAVRAEWPAGVDKVLNGVTGEAAKQALRALRKGGRMVDLPGELTDIPPDVEVVTDYVVRADGDRLGRLATMIDYGEVKVHVEAVYAFDAAPKALARVLEKHVRGTIALALP
jgi:NADPH:quinone reductase-like Zn-dependent oxidoreductase